MVGTGLLHIAVFLVLVLQILMSSLKSEPERHVFELVAESPPAPRPEQSQPTPSVPEIPQIEMPQVREMPQLRDPVIPPPTPQPPTPAPTPPQTQRPTPTPTPPEPAPRRELIDISQHVPPQPNTTRTQPRNTPRIEAPTIDVSRVNRELQSMLSTPAEQRRAEQMTPELQNELARYGARLNGRINAAWNKPQNLDGNLVAEVEFQVSPAGLISNIRFRPSSGNAAFDESVRRAFQKVGSGGATPTGQSHTFTMRFRMVDR